MTIRSLSLSRCVSAFILAASVFLNVSTALAQRSSGISGEFLKTYGLSAQGVIRGLDLTPLAIDPNAKPLEIKAGPKLLEDARRVFRGGNQPLAMELFFAHAVAEYDQGQDALKAVRFSQNLRRPVWQIRWAVSLAVHGGDAGNANPIPSTGTSAGRGMGSTEENSSSVLESALGLVATTFADEWTQHLESGDFGEMLGLLNDEQPEEMPNQARPTRQSSTNEVEEPVKIGAAEAILRSAPTPPSMWRPGIVFLGEGASAEMVTAARNLGIDLLVHFDVSLKMDRDEKVENDSRCRVIQVVDGKMLAVSKGIDHQEAERFSKGGRRTTDEYVQEQLAPVFAVMKKSKVSEMPSLTEEIAEKRVGQLLSSAPLSGAKKVTLRALAEIRAYQSLGLLQPSDVDAAMSYIGGREALFLIHGPLDERLQQARQWAVDALSTEGSK